MSLVDDIVGASSCDVEHPKDELGLAIWDNIDYYVARVLAIQERDRESKFTTHQLHMRDQDLYFGENVVREDMRNFYYYTESDKRLNQGQIVLFWKKLKTCLPRLDKTIIQISDNLFWDKIEGEILNKEELYGKISPEKSENTDNS